MTVAIFSRIFFIFDGRIVMFAVVIVFLGVLIGVLTPEVTFFWLVEIELFVLYGFLVLKNVTFRLLFRFNYFHCRGFL